MSLRGLAAVLLSAALAQGLPAGEPPAPRDIVLDLAVTRDPVASGTVLRLFGESGRNQRMDVAADAAPDCSPVPIETALQPVVCGGAVFALDGAGALWSLAGGFPKTVDQLAPGALALLTGPESPAVLYADRLRLPSRTEVPLPLKAESGCTLEGGWWVAGEGRALLVTPEGRVAWTWIPKKGLVPGGACVSGGRVFAATSQGVLVALDRQSGRERWQYRTGGPLGMPQPGPEGGVLLTSSDHTVRRLSRRGQLVWQYRLSARPAGPPVPVGGSWLVAERGGRMAVLLDGASGKARWRWEAPGGEILFAPAVAGRTVCLLVSTGQVHPTLWLLTLPAEKAP